MAEPTSPAYPPGSILDQNGRPWREQFDGQNWAIPHVTTFAGLLGQTFRAYWHDKWDEARRHSRQDALVMENDAGLQGLLQERKLAVASLPWHLEVPNDKDARQVEVRDALAKQIRGIKGLGQILMCLLDAIWFGRHGAQVRWKWVQSEGRRLLTVRDWRPVRGDKIGHKFDGAPYVLLYPGAANDIEAHDPTAELINTNVGGRGLVLRGWWRERFLLHRHECVDADFLDLTAAEAVHGVGVRSRIFWLDWLKREWMANITSYMEKVGLGVELWYYPAGNANAAKEARAAATAQEGTRTRLLVPRFGGSNESSIERIEVPMSGAEFLLKLIEHVEELQRVYVCGQTTSAGQKKTGSGLGNEADAEFQQDTKLQIRNYDAGNLAEIALTGDEDEPGLVSMMQKWSFPETVPSDRNPDGFWVRFKFSLEAQESAEKLQAVTTVVGLGLPVKADEVYETAGLTRPEEDDDVVEGQVEEEPDASGEGKGGGGKNGNGNGNGGGWQPFHGPKGGHHLKGPDGQTTPMKGGRKVPFAREGAPERFGGHDVSGEARVPAGQQGGGEWMAGGGKAPRMPQGHKDWGKLLKGYSDKSLSEMADRIIAHVGDKSFSEQVEWQASNYQGLHGSGLQSRPHALRARAAIEALTGELANAAGMSRKGEAGNSGASSGHFVSGDDEAEAWGKAWAVAHSGTKLDKAMADLHKSVMAPPSLVQQALDMLSRGEEIPKEIFSDFPGLKDQLQAKAGGKSPFERAGAPERFAAPWDENKHKRGQPENAGQFGPGGGGHAGAGQGGAKSAAAPHASLGPDKPAAAAEPSPAAVKAALPAGPDPTETPGESGGNEPGSGKGEKGPVKKPEATEPPGPSFDAIDFFDQYDAGDFERYKDLYGDVQMELDNDAAGLEKELGADPKEFVWLPHSVPVSKYASPNLSVPGAWTEDYENGEDHFADLVEWLEEREGAFDPADLADYDHTSMKSITKLMGDFDWETLSDDDWDKWGPKEWQPQGGEWGRMRNIAFDEQEYPVTILCTGERVDGAHRLAVAQFNHQSTYPALIGFPEHLFEKEEDGDEDEQENFARPGAPERFAFDPGEPRVPAGQPGGGEWTAHGVSSEKEAAHKGRVVGKIKQALDSEAQAERDGQARLDAAHASGDKDAWRRLLFTLNRRGDTSADRLELRKLYHQLPGDAYEPRSKVRDGLSAKHLEGDTWIVNDDGFVHPRSEANTRLVFGGEIPGHDPPDHAKELAKIDNARRLEKEFPQTKESLKAFRLTKDLRLIPADSAEKGYKLRTRQAQELLWDGLPVEMEKRRGDNVVKHLNGVFALVGNAAGGPKLVTEGRVRESFARGGAPSRFAFDPGEPRDALGRWADAVHALAREVPDALEGHTNPGNLPSHQSHKPLVADVWEHAKGRGQAEALMGPDRAMLSYFKDKLWSAHEAGHVALARVDLPQVVRGEKGVARVNRSEIHHPLGEQYGTFHTLDTNGPAVRQRHARPGAPERLPPVEDTPDGSV